MSRNSKLYEINTRVWLKKFGNDATLKNLPFSVFEELSKKNFQYVWMMGIWKNCSDIIDPVCFSPELIESYNNALRDWQKEDVIGSPYSIDEYVVNPLIGTSEDLKIFKEKLNRLNLKLILDFVPNHFGASTKYLKSNPEMFLRANKELLEDDPTLFYSPFNNPEVIFAHGRDPFFPAWTDTVQINFFSENARASLIDILLAIAEVADGVRCDMAMLPLNNVFESTWLGVLNKFDIKKPKEEFWKLAIDKVKLKYPDFIFIGEAYWDLEWTLQKLGFDFTYDKRLTDRLAADDLNGVRSHLRADEQFQKKSVRFIENHDELRAVAKYGVEKSLAAATLISTIQGMKLYYNGQFEGKKYKVPVQLGREPVENTNELIKKYYDKLLSVTADEIFTSGKWNMLQASPVDVKDNSYLNFFAWEWVYNNQRRIVVINYSNRISYCRLKFDVSGYNENLLLKDLLSDVTYERSKHEIQNAGLFIELKPFHSHIFSIIS